MEESYDSIQEYKSKIEKKIKIMENPEVEVE
jgi:hypothetical protein